MDAEQLLAEADRRMYIVKQIHHEKLGVDEQLGSSGLNVDRELRKRDAGTILRHLFRIAVTLFVGGLLAATLVRFAPGFDTDEQQMDSRLSTESIASAAPGAGR